LVVEALVVEVAVDILEMAEEDARVEGEVLKQIFSCVCHQLQVLSY